MAPEKNVDIGTFSIASKVDKNLALTVSTSMSLSLPDHFSDHLTGNELRDQVRAGALWLTRARSCRLTLDIQFERPVDMSAQGDAHSQLAIEEFQSLSVWRDLGLELHPELNDLRDDRTPSATSVYYIQHGQQNSGLFVPEGIPCGYLSELYCSFRYAATTSTVPETTEESVPRPRIKTCYNLRKPPRASIEPRHVGIVAFWSLPTEVQADRVVYLTQNALNLLMGMKRRCLGIQYLGGTRPLALLQLAPAVWNAQYFQNVVSRAQLIPAISSALGRLMRTQSPVLRQKIGSLGQEPATRSGLDGVLDELHRRTQVLLLRSARDQKTKTCQPRTKPSVPNAFTRNDFTDYASLDLVKESLHGQEHSQLYEAMSGVAGHGLMHTESESSYAFTTYSAGSADSDEIDLGPEEHCMDNEIADSEWSNHDVLSYTTKSLLECGGAYNEDFVDDETFDRTYEGREYEEQLLAAATALQQYDTENAGFYGESNNRGRHCELSDIEERLRPAANAFEDYSVESNRPAGTLKNSGDELLDFVGDEDDVLGIEIYDHLREEGIGSEEYQYDPCEPNDDYDEGTTVHGDNIDDGLGPNYITGGHAHHNNQAQAAGGYSEVGSRRAPQDWSQVHGDFAYHDTKERWARPGPRPTAFTSW